MRIPRVSTLIWLLCQCGARTDLGTAQALDATSGPIDAASPVDEGTDVSAKSDASPTLTCPFTTASFLVDEPQSNIREVAVDNSNVYYVELSGAIWSVAKSGGKPVLFANADSSGRLVDLSTFAMDEAYLYYESAALGTLVRKAKSGGPEVVIGPKVVEASVVLGGDSLYARSFLGGEIGAYDLIRLPLAGGPSKVVTKLPEDVTDIALDGDVAYLASTQGVLRLDLLGGGITTLALAPEARYLAFDASRVFVSPVPFGATSNQIYGVLKADGTVDGIVSAGTPFKLLLDDSWLYFGDQDDGNVHRVMSSGGTVTKVGGFPGDWPEGIAVDDACVYWGSIAGVVVAPK